MKETKPEIIKQLKKLSAEEIAGVIQNLEEKCANATMSKYQPIPEGDHYVLFVWQKNLPPMKSFVDIFSEIGNIENPAESYADKRDYGRTLLFVKMSKNIKELSAIIRGQPLNHYVLLRGGLMNVSSMTHVFVDGKNAETLESEWA